MDELLGHVRQIAGMIFSGMAPDQIEETFIKNGFPADNAHRFTELTIVCSHDAAALIEEREFPYSIDDIAIKYGLEKGEIENIINVVLGKIEEIAPEEENSESFQSTQDAITESMENFSTKGLKSSLDYYSQVSDFLDEEIPHEDIMDALVTQAKFPENLAKDFVADSVAIKQVLEMYKDGNNPVDMMDELGFKNRKPYATMMTLHLIKHETETC